MGAPKLKKQPETRMTVVHSAKNSRETRHNPKHKEIKTQLEIVRETEKLDKKTKIIPATKLALAKESKAVLKSREKTLKATDNNMGKGGQSSTTTSGKKSGKKGKVIKLETAKKTSAQMELLKKTGLELEEHKEITETYLNIWNDEEKLKTQIETAQKLKKHKGLLKYFAEKGEKIPDKPTEILNKLTDDFITSDIDKKTGKEVRRFKSLTEFVSGKKSSEIGFFEKIKIYWRALWSGKLFMYWGIKNKAEKQLLFWDYGRRKIAKYEKIYHKTEEKVKKGIGMVKSLNPEVKRLRDTIKNPALRAFISRKNMKIKNIMQDMPKLGPEKFPAKLSAEYAKLNKEGLAKFGKEWIHAVQHGNVPGVELVDGKGAKILRGAKINGLKVGGRIAFFRVTAQTLKEAIRARNWGKFKATVTSSTWISNTAEMLPIYGTIASFKRLNDFSTGTSETFRKFEFGLNLAFDLMMIIPFILAEGVSFGFATPFLLAIRGAAGKGIKFLAKYLVKSPRIMKWIAKNIPKLAEKAVAKYEARTVEKIAGKTITKKVEKSSTKEAVEMGAKTVGKSTKIFTKKQIWKEIKWVAGESAIMEGINVAISHKDKLLNMAVDMSGFNKTQKKVIKMAGHKLVS